MSADTGTRLYIVVLRLTAQPLIAAGYSIVYSFLILLNCSSHSSFSSRGGAGSAIIALFRRESGSIPKIKQDIHICIN